MGDRAGMKADFSMGDALGAGFRLFRRQPAAVLGWGALHCLLAVGAWFVMIPMLRNLSLTSTGAASELEDLQAMMGFQAAISGLNLAQMVVSLLVWTAVMRATLKPGRTDPFLFLRVGMDELRVAVMAIALFVGLYAFLLLVVVVGLGLGFALHAIGTTAMVAGLCLYGAAALVVLLIGGSRACLLMPMTMITGRFAFEEGWRVGKGRTAKLVGLNLLLFLIYYLSSIVFAALVVAALVGVFFATGAVWPTDPETFDDVFRAVRPVAPWAALALIPAIPFTGWLIAFLGGAVTTAARQLADGALPSAERDVAEASR